MNIFEKLNNIAHDLSNVAKNLEVGYGASKYKAVGEADVLKAVKPLEHKYKVFSYPVSRSIIESGQLEQSSKDGVVKKSMFMRVEVVYRFINIEEPSEYIDIISYGDGVDAQDKAPGKALTYADKYALLKAYKIITGDDPDQNASEEVTSVKIKKQPLSPQVLAECTALDIKLENAAIYYKIPVEALTDGQLRKLIEIKKTALKKKNEVKASE